MWIWEQPEWPNVRYDASVLLTPIATAAQALGRLRGRVSALDVAAQDEASYLALVDDVVKSSEIEGELLDLDSVRSALAFRLGIPEQKGPYDARTEGMAEAALDATERANEPLTAHRLKAWQAALFPPGSPARSLVSAGEWRTDEHGPMQVVSGSRANQIVHFEAPPASRLNDEVGRFLQWFERSDEHLLLKAGLSHLWFVTLHPFEDGNGRISRLISDLVLSRFDGAPYRFYSLSAQIKAEQSDYYKMLEVTQGSSMDVTRWLEWFLQCLTRAASSAECNLEGVFAKAKFRQRMADAGLSGRQIKALNEVLNGFVRPITNRTWASLINASADTALRDINSLVDAGILVRLGGGGRSAAYWMAGVPMLDRPRQGVHFS